MCVAGAPETGWSMDSALVFGLGVEVGALKINQCVKPLFSETYTHMTSPSCVAAVSFHVFAALVTAFLGLCSLHARSICNPPDVYMVPLGFE